MKYMTRFGINIVFFLFMMVIFLPAAAAFGVTAPYWDTKPLGMHPGEVRELQIVLQNMVGNKDVTLKGSIEEGMEIATLIDKDTVYHIPFGRKDITVNLRIQLPEKAKAGEKKIIIVSFNQVADEEGKMVQLGGGVKTQIPIVVQAYDSPSGTMTAESIFSAVRQSTLGMALFVAVLLVLLGIIFWFFKRDS